MVKKAIKIIISTMIFIISYSNIAMAKNVLIINEFNQRKNSYYKVWLDTGKTIFIKEKNDPYDYVGDMLSTEIRYEYKINDMVVLSSNIRFTFSLNGQWYASNGGSGIYRNNFGTFTNVEEAFPMRPLYSKRDTKIFKAVMKYWKECVEKNNGRNIPDYTVELKFI